VSAEAPAHRLRPDGGTLMSGACEADCPACAAEAQALRDAAEAQRRRSAERMPIVLRQIKIGRESQRRAETNRRNAASAIDARAGERRKRVLDIARRAAAVKPPKAKRFLIGVIQAHFGDTCARAKRRGKVPSRDTIKADLAVLGDVLPAIYRDK
jgi:hypothetical protein